MADTDFRALFGEDDDGDGDPGKVVLPPHVATTNATGASSKSSTKKKKSSSSGGKHSRQSLQDELDAIPTEQGKFAKLAEIAEANKPAGSPKKKSTTLQSKASQSQKKQEEEEEEELSPQFPHAGDLERIVSMLKMTLEANWRAQLPESDPRRLIRDELGQAQQATVITKRLGTFARQLRDALVKYFTERKNTVMADVVKQLQHCTVHLFPHPKPINPEKPSICIWSMKVITEPSLVRCIGLVPRKKEQEHLAASFHMHLDYVPVLKAIYTAMFFSYIVSAELVARFSKAPFITTDWKDYFVKSDASTNKKDDRVGDFVERAPSQLSAAVAIFTSFLPKETFIVKTPATQ